MTRIPEAFCVPCQKRSYRSKDTAREALGNQLERRKKRPKDYAMSVYVCPVRRTRWHVGHNPRAIREVERYMEQARRGR